MIPNAQSGQQGQSGGIGTKKVHYLKKNSAGSTYLPWFIDLRQGMAWHTSSAVQEFGVSVLSDTSDWNNYYKGSYVDADENEKRELSREKGQRKSAATIVWNLILSLLGDEVRQLVEADSEYREVDFQPHVRNPFLLLKVVKRIVTTGITSDSTYQCMVNLRNLNEIKQRPTESVRAYVDRVKAAVDVFDATSPYGHVFSATDMIYRRPSKKRAILGPTGSSEVGDERHLESQISSEQLVPVAPVAGCINPKFAVMVAISGLAGKHDGIKNEWKSRLQDADGGGGTIPKSLDDLVERVQQYSAIDKEFAKGEIIEGHYTQSGKGKGRVVRARSGNAEKAGAKNSPIVKGIPTGYKCFLCKETGHFRKDCPSLKQKSESSDKDDTENAARKDRRKGKKSPDGKEIVVKATELLETYESECVDAHDQFFLYATESAGSGGDDPCARNSTSILFDNCANESIICNVNLLTDVRQITSKSETVKTMYGSVKRSYSAVGTLVIAGVGHQVFLDENASDNIVSYGKFEEACMRIGYGCMKPIRRPGDRPIAAQVIDTDRRVVLTVFGEGRMARVDLAPDVNLFITEYGKTMSKEELDRAVLARQLQSRLGNASMTAVNTMLARGSIITSIKGKDLILAQNALGPSAIEQKAKRARVKASVRRVLAGNADAMEVRQTLYGDIFSTMGKEFLIAVAEPMHLICTDNMPSDKGFTHKEINTAIDKVKGLITGSGFDVDSVHFDSAGKKGALSIYPDIKVHAPGQHVAQAERGIRTVKETLRGFVQDRPWLPWWGRFAIQAVSTASLYISLRHAKNSKSRLSPYQQLTGTTPVVDRDFKAAFGDLVLVENLRDESSKSLVTRPRMIEAVWLRPTFDDHGSATVLLLDTGIIAVRILSMRIEWDGRQKELNQLYAWAGAARTDTEMREIQFVEGGKVYDLRVIKPDLGADVVWESGTDEDEIKVLIGKSSGAFPLPTRQEQGIDLPAASVMGVVDIDLADGTPSVLKEGVGDLGPTAEQPVTEGSTAVSMVAPTVDVGEAVVDDNGTTEMNVGDELGRKRD